jgi:hypothetical protein
MRIESLDLEQYDTRIEALEKLSTLAPVQVLAEARHLTEAILRQTAPGLDLQTLDEELTKATDLDLELVVRTAQQLLRLELPVTNIGPDRKIEPQEEFKRLSEAIRELRAEGRQTNAWWQLELIADSRLMLLLVSAASANHSLAPLVSQGIEKLQHLSELEMAKQWGRVQSEFDSSRALPHFDAADLDPDFLRSDEVGALRKKLARYVLELKPQLIARRIRSKVFTYPSESLGPARLLSINTTIVELERDPLRLELVHALSRISVLWQSAFKSRIQDLAELLKLPSASRLLTGTTVQDAFGAIPDASAWAPLAVYYLRALLSVLRGLMAAASPVVDVMTRYKLGLEVTLPKSAKTVSRQTELGLQKELCRYLLDHGIYAEGTKFGPFEADLVATIRQLATVLEVKIYRTKPPSEKTVNANLAQLQDYMEKRPVRPKGILVLYNLTDRLLVAPNKWIRNRYWITCINLGTQSGSRRRECLVLDEGSERLLTFARA